METVVWLVEHNVNVSILNFKAEMAYDIAKKRGFNDIAKYLAEPSGIKNAVSEVSLFKFILKIIYLLTQK